MASKVLRGIINYRQKIKPEMALQLKHVNQNLKASAVFLTCVDTRLHPSTFTQVKVGDMFISRNVGNLVPNASFSGSKVPLPEAAVLEFGVVVNKLRHVFICGHSDCKAMIALKGLPKNPDLSSPVVSWLSTHGQQSLAKYYELESADFRKPLTIQAASSSFSAYVDKGLEDADKLSQVNTLVQLENIASYPFIAKAMQQGQAQIHALWFDVYSGEVLFFSRKHQHFLPITEDNVEDLLAELDDTDFDQKSALNNLSNGPNVKKCC